MQCSSTLVCLCAFLFIAVAALPAVYEVHVGTTTRENKLAIASHPGCKISAIHSTYFDVRGTDECFSSLESDGFVVKPIRNSVPEISDVHFTASTLQIGEVSTLASGEPIRYRRHRLQLEFSYTPEGTSETNDLIEAIISVALEVGCSLETIQVDLTENSQFGALDVFHGAPATCTASRLATELNQRFYISLATEDTPADNYNFWGPKVLQNGVLEPKPDSDRFLEAQGFTGSGEVIGIGDTGLDVSHCSFYDTAEVPFVNDPTTCAADGGSAHRKIACYIDNQGDRKDYPADHGTHVAGTAAGKPESSNTKAKDGLFTPEDLRGSAPDAKIWFHDLQACNDPDPKQCPGIASPASFASGYFQPAYDRGVRVYSSSWGRSEYYTTNAVETDQFVWANRDMVVLFAVGNDAHGEDRRTVFGSVGTPGDSKNIIGVGATRAPQIEWKKVCEESQLKQGNEATLCSQAVGSDEYNSMTLANFSSQGPTNDGRAKPDLVAPGDPVISAKSGDTNAPNTCSTVPGEGNYRWLSLQGTSMATPMLAGSTVLMRQWLKSLSATVVGSLGSKNFQNQPDYYPSAALVRGALTLSASPLDRFLVKPLIKSLTLGDPVNIKRNTLPYPSHHFGHGLPNHKAVVDLENSTVLSLLDEGTIPGFTDSDQMRILTFNVPDGYEGEIEAVLSWLDYPGEQRDGRLIHDLDLIVQSPSGRVFIGNHGVDGTSYAMRKADRFNVTERVRIPSDLVSEVGTWRVIIYAYHIQTSMLLDLGTEVGGRPYAPDVTSSTATINNTVPFALILKASEHATYVSDDSADLDLCINSCWEDGYGRGTCNAGTKRCTCNDGWTGLDCSHKVTELELGTAEFFDVQPYDRLIFKFQIDPPPAGVNGMNLGFRARSGPNQQNIENWPSNNYIPWGKANTDIYVWRGNSEPKPAEWNRIDGTDEDIGLTIMTPKDASAAAYSVQQRSGGADTNRVYIEDVEPGTYYALIVVKDPVARGMLEVEAVVNPCSQACNAAGSCAGNVCMCYEHYYGATCNKGTGNGAWRVQGSKWLLALVVLSAMVLASLL